MVHAGYLRRAAFLLTVVLILLSAAPLASSMGYGRFDLDVLFVIDCSGSMKYSDPNKMALSAANLFIDKCEGSDTRVGYVLYSHEILDESGLIEISDGGEELKQSIAHARRLGDTDIALGLDAAFSTLARTMASDGAARKPVVILLSDGNTDLPNGPRTKEESLDAFEAVKHAFADAGIPVYTIGFNYDGKLDTESLASLAETTGALPLETASDDELPIVLSIIYEHLTQAKSVTLPPVPVTGESQSIAITVENDSIYKMSVTIMHSMPLETVGMTDPGGETPSDDILTINKDPNNKYTLLTLYYPRSGDWTLNFKGRKGDTATINLLSVYELAFVANPPSVDADGVHVSYRIESPDGEVITDAALRANLTAALHYSTPSGYKSVSFEKGKDTAVFRLPEGDYDGYLTLEGLGMTRQSESFSFTMPPEAPKTPALSFTGGRDGEYKATLWTIFRKSVTLKLGSYIAIEDGHRPLSISVVAGDWNEHITITYDPSSESLTFNALELGQAEALIRVTGADGSTVGITAAVGVNNGIILIFTLAGVLAAIGIVLILSKLSKRPYLNDPSRYLHISVSLPPGRLADTPDPADLPLERTRGKRSLQQIIDNASDVSTSYNNALSEIQPFLGALTFSAVASGRKAYFQVTCPDQIRGFRITHPGKMVSGTAMMEFQLESIDGDDRVYYSIRLNGGGDDGAPVKPTKVNEDMFDL